jgi:hypothetical protein
MSCNCNESKNNFVSDRQNYNCDIDRQVIKHDVVVKHQHDIIHEYDVVHEHEYNYYDVIKTHDVAKNNDYRNYKPNYCGEEGKCDKEKAW